jgi:uncharacterized protein (TIGR03067 family)
MKTTTIVAVCSLSVLLCAIIVGCSKPATEKPTVKPILEGRWSGFENGSTEKIILTFTGNRFAYFDAQSNGLGSGTFVVNDTAKPRQMDLTFEKIPAPQYVGKVGLAIYEFQGEALKIAGSEPGSDVRPATFDAAQGVRIFTWRRE